MKKAKILVVEDEAIIAKLLQSQLQRMGYDVPYTAANGEEAIDISQKIRPDLVLMDVLLQGQIDGIETARQIRSKGEIPIIYLSAYTDEMLYERAKDTEPFGYLSKPFSEYALRNTIEMALYKHNAEKAMRQEKEFTDKAINAQVDTFFVFDHMTGKAIRWNNKFREISGYTDEEIADLKAPDSYYSPDDLKKAAAVINEVLIKGKGTVEIELICKDGRRVPTEYLASAIKDEENNLKYIISIGRDITERNKAEEKRSVLLKAIEITQEAINIVSQDGEILYTNNTFDKLFGYKKEELIGKNISVVNAEPKEKMAEDIMDTIETEGWWEGEIKNIRKDSTKFISYAKVSPIKDESGNIINIVSAQHDITTRKKYEDELKENEEKYRSLIENIDLGVTIIDTNHNILMVNNVIGKWFNKSPDEFIGKKCYKEFEKKDNACPYCPGVRAMSTGQPCEVESRGVRDDGSVFYVRDRAFPFNGPNGEVIGFHEIIEDITEQKKVKELLEENKGKNS
jgi:PAS domain S-box-containing protein